MDTITTAPRSVIDALDNWQEVTDTQFVYSLMRDIDECRYGLSVVNTWIYFLALPGDWLERELAVIEHALGDVRLEEEDEYGN